MTGEEYMRPSRILLSVFLIIGLMLAIGMFLVLQPSVLALLSGRPVAKSSQVNVTIPNGIGSDKTLNFQPSEIIVKVGVNNTIVWTDFDSTGQSHTVTTKFAPSPVASFDSGPLSDGDTFSQTPTAVGTYHYRCLFHASWMQGTITVIP